MTYIEYLMQIQCRINDVIGLLYDIDETTQARNTLAKLSDNIESVINEMELMSNENG